MLDYFRKKNILKHSASNSSIKAGICEQINKLIKMRLYRYFTESKTVRWVDVIQDIVTAINATPTKSTGMKPVDVNFKNATEVHKRVYGKAHKVDNSKAVQPDDHVRIAREKMTFRKGYLPTHSDNIYRVRRTVDTAPKTYELEMKRGRAPAGRFYRQELSKTTNPEASDLKMERVMQRRMVNGERQYLVKWYGLPKAEASWMSEQEMLATNRAV
jgi:Chromo (CHRromatin Organisation MOdifier) domain